MQVYGCLSWFDEEPSWLAACVSSMSKLCSHVVALDGAYGLFPTPRATSAPIQAETIARTADGLGMGWTIHTPQEKWWDGEVSKRSALLRIASDLADPTDWLLVLDADEILKGVWSGTRNALIETDRDVVEMSLIDEDGGRCPLRRMYRALPGLRVEDTHYNVIADKDGERVVLAGDPLRRGTWAESLLMLDLEIMHRGAERTQERKEQKAAYYRRAIPIEQEALAGRRGGEDAEVVR